MNNLTSKKFKEIVNQCPIVILPLGSCEQHGPAGSICTDFLISEYLGEQIAKEMNLISLPSIPFGYSKIHDSFPGTITIDEDIYYQFVKCIIRKLKIQGIKGIVLLNGHGGNLIPLRKLLQEEGDSVLFMEWYKLSKNLFFSDEHKSHAGSEELSVLGAISSDYLFEENIEDMIPAPYNPAISNVWEKFEYITLNGVHLLANQYCKETGELVIQYVVREACKRISEFIDFLRDQEGKVHED